MFKMFGGTDEITFSAYGCVAAETGGGAERQSDLRQCWSEGRRRAVAYKQTKRLPQTFCEYGRPADLLFSKGLKN